MAIDRTSKFAVAQLVEKANRKTAWEFLEHLLEAVPYRIHTILTERAVKGAIGSSPMASGSQFAEQPRNRDSITLRKMRFDLICEANGIEHRLTKPNHPWSLEDQETVRETVSPTNGQVERMNRTIKEGEADQNMIRGIIFPLNVKHCHYDSQEQLRCHLADFLDAYNFARRLKTLSGLTIRIHLQSLDIRARQFHPKSDPPRLNN